MQIWPRYHAVSGLFVASRIFGFTPDVSRSVIHYDETVNSLTMETTHIVAD